MKKKPFAPVIGKTTLSLVSLFVFASDNAAEPEPPIIDVRLGLSYFDLRKEENRKPLFTSPIHCTFTRRKWLIEVMSDELKTSSYYLYDDNNGDYVLNTTQFYDHNYDEETINAAVEMGFALVMEPIPNNPR